MTIKIQILFTCAVLFLSSSVAPEAQRGAAGPVTAIVGARLIDGTGGPAVQEAMRSR